MCCVQLGEWNTFQIYVWSNSVGISNTKGKSAKTDLHGSETARALIRTLQAIKDSDCCEDLIEVRKISKRIPEKGFWTGNVEYKLLKPLIDE